MTSYSRRHYPNRELHLHQDSYLAPFHTIIEQRCKAAEAMERRLTENSVSLQDFASGHEYYGLHYRDGNWIFREWAPNARKIYLIGDFSNWHEEQRFRLHQLPDSPGVWEILLPEETLSHGMHYRLRVYWHGGQGERIPAYARRVVQDKHTLVFSAQVWRPEQPYRWQSEIPPKPAAGLIYEAHVGMGQEYEGVGSYLEFRDRILPRIAKSGYNTIQLMAVMEHPYYGSFGYHVTNFFAASSRFGTPEEFKALVDAAHGMGLRIIIDLIHSHAARNEVEGLGRFDGTGYQYFHEGGRGEHSMWDSYCFDYSKPEVLHFLLSNCRFWLDEYKIDGFRFDGVTSMLYHHHGLGHAFTSYHDYFNGSVDEEALTYLSLANKVIHLVRPDAVTVAEDVSGMPGLAAPVEHGGCGFDYRLAMGVTDYWFKLFDLPDEQWHMGGLWHELTNRRQDEKTISYVECHDQAIVGGQTMIFRLMGDAMYDSMCIDSCSMVVDRAIALHKMARLVTIATASNGYLNFMGNEFGHPEWVDFPRAGNDWSYKYARRQWSLADSAILRYKSLWDFDRKMLELIAGDKVISSARPQLLKLNEKDKVLAFERNGFFFFFNFHPVKSQVDYSVITLPGEYVLVLDSDSGEFGGHNRIHAGQHYFTSPEKHGNEQVNVLKIYLPARSAIVLRKLL